MEQNNNSKKLAQEWFSRADDDLLFAKAGFKETDIAADACFLSHQAVEKYLKGLIVHSINDYLSYKKFTTNLATAV